MASPLSSTEHNSRDGLQELCSVCCSAFAGQMAMYSLIASALLAVAAAQLPQHGVSSFRVSEVPTSVFSSYWQRPNPTAEPQPIIYDPVLDFTFPLELTDPDNIPESSDEVLFPVARGNLQPHEKHSLIESLIVNVTEIIKSQETESSCSRCQRALVAAKPAAQYAPMLVPEGGEGKHTRPTRSTSTRTRTDEEWLGAEALGASSRVSARIAGATASLCLMQGSR